MSRIATVGLDLAKNVFQMHGADGADRHAAGCPAASVRSGIGAGSGSGARIAGLVKGYQRRVQAAHLVKPRESTSRAW